MHQQFTVGQRAGLLRDAFTTRRNHITDGTRAGYERKALMLFDFCDRMRLPRQFRYQQMAAFFQWYCGSLDLANTSLQGFLSAWRSFSDERGEFFPGSDSREFQRIRQFIRGAQVRYPHEVRRDTPLTLSILSYVAEALGITKLADYRNCPPSTLIFMARILTAHHAMMRSMEHADGCMFGDVTLVNAPSGLIEYIIFRVGQAASARKIKRRPARLTIVPCEDHHMSAGSVLHMAISITPTARRRATDILFMDHIHGIQSTHVAPWQEHQDRLRRLLRRVPASVDITLDRIGRSSLRAGGATDWFQAGASREWIMLQGGWLSDAVDIYNRPTPASRFAQVAHVVLSNSANTHHPR